MRLQRQLQLIGLALVISPAFILTLVYSFSTAAAMRSAAANLVSANNRLLLERLASSYDTLRRGNLASNDFFIDMMRKSEAARFAKILGPGQGLAIVSADGILLEGYWVASDGGGVVSAATGPLPAGDGLRSVMGGREDGFRFASPALGGAKRISASSWLEPAGWTLVYAVDEMAILDQIARIMAATIVVSLALSIAAFLVLVITARKVSDPLASLAMKTRELRIGRAELKAGIDIELKGSASDEIRDLAREFDAMAKALGESAEGLELRVAERTAELAHTIERMEHFQSKLVQSEKLAALGQLVTGIAHELNTPLGAILSSSSLLDTAYPSVAGLVTWSAALSAEDRDGFLLLAKSLGSAAVLARPVRKKLYKELVVELTSRGFPNPESAAESLSDAGLGASDLRPGLRGTEGQALVGKADELAALFRATGIIGEAARRAVRVIEALRLYSRQSSSALKAPVDLAANLETALTLFDSKLRLGVEVVRDYRPVPPVLAEAEKLAQVWTNLIANALYAMEYSGTLGLRVRAEGNRAIVQVADSGSGIPSVVAGSLFTPFFTTKPAGEGTGLGLEISRRIVEDCGGTIDFESVPGRTVFTVRIPCQEGIADRAPIASSP